MVETNMTVCIRIMNVTEEATGQTWSLNMFILKSITFKLELFGLTFCMLRNLHAFV